MRHNLLAARDAADVVLDPESLKLLAVVVVGWWMMGTATTGASGGLVQTLLGMIWTLTALVGTLLYYAGLLALLVKLVHDAVVLARLR